MIFNIVSLILFFTSVIPLVHTLSGTEVAAFTVRELMSFCNVLYLYLCVILVTWWQFV